MLSLKKIDKIRHLFFDVGMSVTNIWRKTNVSPTSIYKYIKMKDFTPLPAKPRAKRPSVTDKYVPIIKQWLLEDKTSHHKQRHTAIRVYERLQEIYPDIDVSYTTISKVFRTIRSEVYYLHKEFAPLRHLPGEAQVDMGECVFFENGIKLSGYYVVVSFPYSNAGFCQLFKGKNAQCFIQGIKNIFHYIGGVPHEVTFDNDGALVNIKDDRIPKRCENDLFLRFKNHYDFRCDYCNSHSPDQKGNVEAKVKYLRKVLLVPIPVFNDIDEYNRELLERCMTLLNKNHYRTKVPIINLFKSDKKALLPLPDTDFEVATFRKRKVDKEGRIRLTASYVYHISPKFTNKYMQVKVTYNKVTIFGKDLNLIVEYDRMYGSDKQTCIEWSIWLPIVSRRANSLFHSPLTDMFSENLKNYLLKGTAKLRREYLSAMAEIVKTDDLDTAISCAEAAVEKNIITTGGVLEIYHHMFRE